ncbi:hypothetical protein HHK36_031195 [Tetracentron sinense]|uniref:TFIIS N-terminal domain-containing protein n=1 Tax=Tetracentron sinense TaxID=13715 RepID=A0A834YCF4_TETSI|nr:hypothetical protein HHK36_031195 [Tetracentron sinense]
MTLEDFFTLTEMKDGLTALARVEELVTVMQEEKDCAVKNISEASRQWSTVASTLAVTENKDCLDHFIRLNGLWFLDRWLQEAQKSSTDTSDSFVEESITALLGALEKLPIDKEKSVSSGIGVTVKNLFVHKSFRVQDRARPLFDCWNQGSDSDAVHQDCEKDEACSHDKVTTSGKIAVESGSPEHSAGDISSFKESANEDNCVAEPAGSEILQSRSSDGSQPEKFTNVKIPTSNIQETTCTNLSWTNNEDGFPDALCSSPTSNPGQESLSSKEESSICPAEGTNSTATGCSPLSVKGNVDGKPLDVLKSASINDDAKEKDKVKHLPDKFSIVEVSSIYTTLGPECVSATANPANAQESVMEPAVPSDVDAKESDFCLRKTSPLDLDSDTSRPAMKPKSGVVNCGLLSHSRSTVKFKAIGQGGECHPNVVQDLSSNQYISRKPEDPETSFSKMENIRAVNDVKELESRPILEVGGGEDLALTANVSQLTMNTKDSDKIDKRRLDIELEYGIDDAPEVARQVAKEVEREVVDYREPFCSPSSGKISEGGVVQPGSPDSINGEQDQSTMGPLNEVPTGKNLSSGASSPQDEEYLIRSENMDTRPEVCMQEESSQVTDAAQEPAGNAEKGLFCFDLNEEVHSEEMDFPTTPISTPISVVAASRAAAAPGSPVAPLQFGGALGWKVSAETSAFRPASSRRILDGGKTLFVKGSNYNSKQRQDLLNIDLNMAGSNDDGVADPILARQIPVSSGLPSGESSIEVSSRRAERLKLDLNCVGENDDTPSSGWRMEGRSLYDHHQNGGRSPSPVSSSSLRQPCMRNIDLNDNLSIFGDSFDQRPDLGKSFTRDVNAYGGFKLDDPVISIMGTKVEVNQKDFSPHTRSVQPNRDVVESAIAPMGANLASTGADIGMRPPLSYTPPHPLVFGYNGLNMGPSISLSSAVYGPGSFPYMVDSRGGTVVPQMMGSAAAVASSYSQPPFLMSMTGPPSGLNGIELTRPNLDLNSGLMVEGGSTESGPGGLRQLFVLGPGGLMGEHMKSAPQPPSLGMGMKRKEPDGGWEYPLGFKQQPPCQ